MSGAGGVDALGRRTWNKEEYAAKAKQLDAMEAKGIVESSRKRTPLVPPNERVALDVSDRHLDLEKGLNERRIISALTEKKNQGGFWCEVCQLLSKDSKSYVEHINGRQHLDMIGMSNKVMRVGADVVSAKLDRMRNNTESLDEKKLDVEDRLILQQQKADERKRRKQEKRKAGGDGAGGEDMAAMLASLMAQAEREGLDLEAVQADSGDENSDGAEERGASKAALRVVDEDELPPVVVKSEGAVKRPMAAAFMDEVDEAEEFRKRQALIEPDTSAPQQPFRPFAQRKQRTLAEIGLGAEDEDEDEGQILSGFR